MRLVHKAAGEYGGLDYAFNNAGLVGSYDGIVDTTEEDWNRVVATNLTGVWLCMKSPVTDPLLTIAPPPRFNISGISSVQECPSVGD